MNIFRSLKILLKYVLLSEAHLVFSNLNQNIHIQNSSYHQVYKYKIQHITMVVFKRFAQRPFFIPILTYFFALLYLLPLSVQQTWKTYTVFNGYIPSYIYPITLNAGDFLRGYLNWPNSQDLDIYLYQQTQDLLSFTTYLKRQYSPTTKPEILQYNITSSNTYFLRIDLYSNTPTAYQFDISVNGQLMSTNFDTIIKVAAGRTVQQFEVNGPCRIRVKYDGPIYNLFLFAPGTNVINGTTVASDTNNTNPKYLDAYLTSGGIWSLVVHHQITSTTVLTPFSIVIQTQKGVDQCINFCSLIDYTEGAIIGYSTICRCVDGFQWVSANQTCSIVCSDFNASSDVGSRISGTSNQCQCLQNGFTWNATYLICVIDCTTKNYATGINTNNSCLCQSGFYWDTSLRNCIRDCSGDNNAISVVRTIADISTFGQCICTVLYYWNANTSKCEINCNIIPFASTDNSSTDNCLCQSGFDWSSLLKMCIINCSSVLNSLSSMAINNTCSCSSNYYVDYSLMACVKNCTYDPYLIEPIRTIANITSLDACVCIANFVININTGLCQIDCQLIHYSNGINSTNSCLCVNQFLWDSNYLLCVRDCSNVSYAIQPNRTQSTLPDFCECQTNYSWNAFLSRCQLDCTLFLYTNSQLPHGIDSCVCVSGFYWQSGPGCLRDCSIIPYAIGNRTNFTNISSDACACDTKFEWKVQTNRCEINCTNINNTQSTLQYDECMCANSFGWDSQLRQCIINCNGISHTQSVPVANMVNYYTCQCISTFSWNDTFNRCEVVCSSINYTDTNLTNITINNGSYNLSYDQCYCIAGFIWNRNTNICQMQNIKPSAQIYIQRLSWTSGGVCGRQLNLTVTEQKKLLHPISHYTQIQLMYGQKALMDQYYTNTDWKLSRVQYFDNQFTVNLTLQLLADPTSSNLIIKLKTSGVVYDYFYAYAEMPSGMAPALYSQSQCSSFDHIENVIKFVFAASYVVMGTGVGSLSNKINGLELFGVLQLAYFSVSSHYSDINMYIYPIIGLKASNGANFGYYDQNNDSFYQSMPNVLKKDTKINGYFANNYNVMFLILVGFTTVLGAVYGVSSFLSLRANGISNRIENTQNPTIDGQDSLKDRKSQRMCLKVKQKSLQILKQGLLTLIMFSIFNISFSAGVFFSYCQQNAQNSTALMISKLVMYISFVIFLVVVIDFVRTGSSTASFGEFKDSFKLNWLCRMYIVISIIYRIVLGLIISLNLNDIYGTLVVLFISITFILFNIINLPFKSVLHNYRANFMHLTQFMILLVANYYRSMKANIALNQKSHIHTPAMIMIVLLVLSLIFSLIVALYESIIKIISFVKKCKKVQQQKEGSQKNSKKLTLKPGLSKTRHHLNVTQKELVAD